MKKFTFIRVIEPAEREEIGIGHSGEGRGAGDEGGGGQEGPGSPAPQPVVSSGWNHVFATV